MERLYWIPLAAIIRPRDFKRRRLSLSTRAPRVEQYASSNGSVQTRYRFSRSLFLFSLDKTRSDGTARGSFAALFGTKSEVAAASLLEREISSEGERARADKRELEMGLGFIRDYIARILFYDAVMSAALPAKLIFINDTNAVKSAIHHDAI